MSGGQTCPECGASIPEAPQLRVGDVLHGFCGGTFGRDSYGEKTVIAIGPNYVVVSERTTRGVWPDYEWYDQLYLHQGDPNELLEYLAPESDDDYDD